MFRIAWQITRDKRKNFRKTAGSSLPLLNEAVLAATEQISFSDFAAAGILSFDASNLSETKHQERKVSLKRGGL